MKVSTGSRQELPVAPAQRRNRVDAADCPVCHGTTDEERLLTPSAVATILDVPRQTLLNWRTSGKGPLGIRVGRHLRYRRSSLNAWIDEQMDKRTPTP